MPGEQIDPDQGKEVHSSQQAMFFARLLKHDLSAPSYKKLTSNNVITSLLPKSGQLKDQI